MTRVLSVVLVAGTIILVAKLALSPFYPRYSAAECRQAYALARSRADTHRIDLHPYDPAGHSPTHHCGELRAARQDSLMFAVHP